MNIKDLIHETEQEELAALGQFFSGRANDKDVAGRLDVDAFVKIANDLGLNVDGETLQQYVQTGNIESISDVNDEEVKFNSKNEVGPEQMTKDKAEMTLQQAAKRAAAKRSK